MLFTHAFDSPDLLALIRRFRQRPVRVYGCAAGAVAVATLLRLALHQELSTTAPFTTYALAVLLITLAGGFWPGITTLALSVVSGSILFLPPAFSFSFAEGAVWTLSMFAFFGTVNVILISGLIAALLAHDEQQMILTEELRHRSKNLFAVIQAIVSRTLASNQPSSEVKRTLQTRLAALARAHAMLADSGWTGAALEQIIAEELSGFSEQVTVADCNLILNTPGAQNFSLIIHELATNAVKYGALSCPQGRIAITGSVAVDNANELFCFAWKETGGPPVSVPNRKGFGSKILHDLARRFAQNLQFSYHREGLDYRFQVPMSTIQIRRSKSATRRSSATTPSPSMVADVTGSASIASTISGTLGRAQ